MAQSHSIIVVGVGPFISSSLARKLVGLEWNIALISRSQARLDGLAFELKKQHPNGKIVTFSADAGDAMDLTRALDDAKSALGTVDVLCYNAARVGPDDLLTVSPEVMEQDFRVAAVGTLVAGQWFVKNANKSRVEHGEYPLLLFTGGVLHKHPFPTYASLSAVKSASQSIATMFSASLPEKHQIQVGQPLIVQPIIPGEDGGYQTKSVPDEIVTEVFMPYFEDRLRVDKVQWQAERVF